ncbi:MAG TPA: hypothetical protein VIW78_13565 [Burkholderiales bacterium]
MSRSHADKASSPSMRARALGTALVRLSVPLRRALRQIRHAPPAIRILIVAVALLALWAAANWIVQAIRKPTEFLFPVGAALVKTPAETWRQYGPLFREHSTAVVAPELLAALAQIEGAGDPLARPPWSWRLAWNPFELYRPSSSAVGMFQITDAAFREGKRYCIHDHAVVEDGPWYDPGSCWFNIFYTRVVPGHAVEMTAALLDRGVANALARLGGSAASLRQKQELAAVIHLCGPARGEAYARRGFRPASEQRCGAQDLARYLAQVNTLKRKFALLAAAD